MPTRARRPGRGDAARGTGLDRVRRAARLSRRVQRDHACERLRLRGHERETHGRPGRRLARGAVVPGPRAARPARALPADRVDEVRLPVRARRAHLPARDRPRLHRVRRLVGQRDPAAVDDAASRRWSSSGARRRTCRRCSTSDGDVASPRAAARAVGNGRRVRGRTPATACGPRRRAARHAACAVRHPRLHLVGSRRARAPATSPARATPTTPSTRPSGGPACRRSCTRTRPRRSARTRVCSAEVGGVITYRDDNHLTAAFASARWRQFAQALDLSKNLRPI